MNRDFDLKNFYFGSINEDDRLKIERELLSDSERLLDYLDLKRQIEATALLPMKPSNQVWQRLQTDPRLRRRAVVSAWIGVAAVAATLVFIFLMNYQNSASTKLEEPTHISVDQVLFDSSREQSASLGVL
jgi:hypothetical protein